MAKELTAADLLPLIDHTNLENYRYIHKKTLWILVRAAILLEEITLSRGAELLGLPLIEMRDIATKWSKEVGVKSSEDLEILVPRGD